IGAVGEIYIGGIGVSQGYINRSDLNPVKFIKNIFTGQGRLYRTGDLGRWLPDGQIQCLGRTDNQIKIRGFRVELDEIDSTILHHPQIRTSATILSHATNGDQVLVSYIVPKFTGPSNYTTRESSGKPLIIGEDEGPDNYLYSLVSEVRESLNNTLPSYSIPSCFVPLTHLPVNANGKIDKLSLPCHKAFQSSEKYRPYAPTMRDISSISDVSNHLVNYSPTQISLNKIWQHILDLDSATPLHSNFFSMGGHSILATRLAIQVQKVFGANIPHSLVFREPTIYGMANEIDRLMLAGTTNTVNIPPAEKIAQIVSSQKAYSADLNTNSTPDLNLVRSGGAPTFFLTGATGFLGTFILTNLLSHFPSATVYCLARAQDPNRAFDRIKTSCINRLVWQSHQQIRAIVGDLAQPHLGITEVEWKSLAEIVDVVIHNGAQIHWMHPYEKLRGPNVLGTLEALKLATTHHIKPFHFISTLSVFTNDYPTHLTKSNKEGYSTDNTFPGSRLSIPAGYDQTKWVADKLILEAQSRGYPCTIVRPGFIVGASQSGVVNTDDFLWRFVKGCIQLGKAPTMDSAMAMCPVDYAAEVIVQVAINPDALAVGTFHIDMATRFSYNNIFDHIRMLGFTLDAVAYTNWCNYLKAAVKRPVDNALYPLLLFVLDSLPEMMDFPAID
ncbi:male sterility protein-domain-containing protein, partial [Dimargaris cristalligena]